MSARSRVSKTRATSTIAAKNSPALWDCLRSDRVIFLGFALAVLLFYFTPLFDSAASIHWDAADEMYPAQKYFSDMVHSGKLPFWTPYVFSGMPFLADPQVGAWYPLNWPFFLLGITPRSLMWEIALHAFLAAAGAYLLARDLLHSKVAAIFVGVLFAFSGFFAGHASHTGIFQAAALAPWLLWTGLRAAKAARWLPLVAIISGLTVLAGHFQTALYALFALVCVLLLDFGLRRGSVRGYVQTLVCAAAGAVLLSAILSLPGLELTGQSIRAGADYRRDAGAHLVPEALITLVSPNHYGAVDYENYTGPQDITQFYLYGGILLVPLALIGAVVSSKRGYALALLIPAVWYSLGPPAGFYSLLAELPGLRNVRAPIHIWFVAALGLALLAGAGVHAIQGRFRSPWLIVALFAVVAVDLWYWNMDRNHLVYARDSFTNLYGAGEDRFRAATAPLLTNALHRIWAPFNSSSFGPLDGSLDNGLEVTFGYNPLELSRYERYLSAAQHNPKLLDGLAVTIKLNASTGALATNAAALPRIYAPENASPVSNSDEASTRLATLDPAHETVVEGLPGPMANNGGARVSISNYDGVSYRVRYDANHATLLRIAVPYFPGWNAEVDGRPVRVFPADLALMAVLVPAGAHELALRYHSTWFATGALISLLSWIVVLACSYLAWRRSRRPSDSPRPI